MCRSAVLCIVLIFLAPLRHTSGTFPLIQFSIDLAQGYPRKMHVKTTWLTEPLNAPLIDSAKSESLWKAEFEDNISRGLNYIQLDLQRDVALRTKFLEILLASQANYWLLLLDYRSRRLLMPILLSRISR